MFSGVGLNPKRLSSRPNPHLGGLAILNKAWPNRFSAASDEDCQMPVASVADTALPMRLWYTQNKKALGLKK